MPDALIDPADLGHRELHLLRTLDHQLRGRPAPAGYCLTAAEYTSTVLALRSRGLCGADVRRVRDDPDAGPVPMVERVWLTVDGRDTAGLAAAAV